MSIKYYMQSSLWRQSSPVYGGKDLWKGRFWACSEKERVVDGASDDDLHELPWV